MSVFRSQEYGSDDYREPLVGIPRTLYSPLRSSALLNAAPVVLVADDDGLRYAIAKTLRHAGMHVVEATDGVSALQLASDETSPLDAVILDVLMPGMDGFEVCRRLKANPETAGIPVLQLSSTLVEVEWRVRGLEGGADAYMAQPFDASEFVATVGSLVRRRRATADVEARAKRVDDQEYRMVSERVRLEHEVRFQVQLLDALEHAVVATDSSGRVQIWNARAASLLGWSSDEAVGRDLIELLSTHDSVRIMNERFNRALDGESWTGSMLLRRKDGTPFGGRVQVTPIRDVAGVYVGITPIVE